MDENKKYLMYCLCLGVACLFCFIIGFTLGTVIEHGNYMDFPAEEGHSYNFCNNDGKCLGYYVLSDGTITCDRDKAMADSKTYGD